MCSATTATLWSAALLRRFSIRSPDSTLQRLNDAAVALRGERDIVTPHGRAEKNARYHRIRRAVRDLGLHLSRDQVFD